MSRTPVKQSQIDFTNIAHQAAIQKVYPKAFNLSKDLLNFRDTTFGKGETEKVLDGQLAIDKICFLNLKHLNANIYTKPLILSIQERFRTATEFYKKSRETGTQYSEQITITVKNLQTEAPSELFKAFFQYFVYGFYDQERDEFLRVVGVDWSRVIVGIAHKQITPSEKNFNDRNQSFITFDIESLRKIGAVSFIYEQGDIVENFLHISTKEVTLHEEKTCEPNAKTIIDLCDNFIAQFPGYMPAWKRHRQKLDCQYPNVKDIGVKTLFRSIVQQEHAEIPKEIAEIFFSEN